MELVRRLWWQVSLEGVSAPHSDSAEFAESRESVKQSSFHGELQFNMTTKLITAASQQS